MNQKLNFFQTGLLILFGLMAVAGVFVLATNKNESANKKISVPIVIWGPLFGSQAVQSVLNDIKKEDDSFEKVSYVEKNPLTIYGDILEAIVSGNSPDLVIMNSSGLLPLKNKLYPISFETIPLSSFKSTYVDGADIFVLPDAVYAIPIFVDPLVLYWNKNIFATEAVAQVPTDWETFNLLVPRFSTIIGGADLVQSAVSFGEYDNVLHAKEILSALLMQTGSSIVFQNNNKFSSSISNGLEDKKPALALSFYTSFSNPNRTVYSWNKTFDRSREAFAGNKVAMYAGFVGEEKTLLEINPNLNYAIAVLPQIKSSNFSVTYGNFYGIGVLKSSQNPAVALYVAQVLTTKNNAKTLSKNIGLPSTRRDVLTEPDVTDPYGHVKTQSAIIAKGWLEPAPQSEVASLFQRMINNVVAGTVSAEKAVTQASQDLEVLLEKYNN